MKNEIKLVEDWHNAFKVPVHKAISIIPIDRMHLRERLLKEEVKELCEAIESDIPEQWLKEMADVLYVLFGTAHELGIAELLPAAFKAVHESNMSKLDANGLPVYRADGKVLKGPNYHEPKINLNY